MISAWIARMIARLYDPAEEARRAQAEESRLIDKLRRHNAEAMKQSARNSIPEE